MPRKRPPHRLDDIADAASDVFILRGYGPARIAEVAARARVGPGTVYLYAAGKEALFDLALRRAFEDPTLLHLTLPHPLPLPGAVAEDLWRCLQNAAHFPELWLAADAPPPDDVEAEVRGVGRELYRWLERYRRGIRLVERAGDEWPEVTQLFRRRFWRGGIRRVADYLVRRMGEGAIPARGDALATAQCLVNSLTWMAVGRHWDEDAASMPEAESSRLAERLVTGVLLG